MKKILRDFSKRAFPTAYWQRLIIKRLVNNEHSFLNKYGWYSSFKAGTPLNENGDETPWMNYAIVNFLKERLHHDLILFEYGSGASTLFFARRVKKIISVEYDEAWFKKVSEALSENVQLVYRNKDVDGDYCRVINHFPDRFDIVIVDGRDRINCIKQSIGKLSDKGVVILDDSDRDSYKTIFGSDSLKDFKSISFTGIKPCSLKFATTTIFYRAGNCLNI